MPRRAWVVGTMLVGTALLAPAPGIVGPGVGAASAATRYYTRKKINGRWVTGRFPATDGAATAAAPQPADATAAPAAGATAAAPAAPAEPSTTARPTAARSAARRVRFVERKGLAKARYSSLPKYRPRVVLRPVASPAPDTPEAKAVVSVPIPPVPPVVQVAPAPATGAAPSNARTSLPPDRVVATASIGTVATVPPGGERMRSALEARARSMATELGILPVPLPAPATAAQLSARSVTFDLQKGLRTVVFEDGTTVTAPFDTGRAETATGLPAAR